MKTYDVFNSIGIAVQVTDEDLDRASRKIAPLSAELADAAAIARRTDLLAQLRLSLSGSDRAQKLATALAVLALADHATIPLLEKLAAEESDSIVAKSFTAVVVRMRGPDAARDYFLGPDADPEIAALLISNYNSQLEPEPGDVRFLIIALAHYLDRSLPWLRKLKRSLWDNDLFGILDALSGEAALRQLRTADLAAERTRLRTLLSRLPDLRLNAETREEAQELMAVLSASSADYPRA